MGPLISRPRYQYLYFYHCIRDEKECLKVGITNNIPRRIREHTYDGDIILNSYYKLRVWRLDESLRPQRGQQIGGGIVNVEQEIHEAIQSNHGGRPLKPVIGSEYYPFSKQANRRIKRIIKRFEEKYKSKMNEMK